MTAFGKNKGQSKSGFTLVELLTVIALIAVLAAMLLPAFARTRAGSPAIQCMSNLRQLSAAWMMYAADNGDRIMSNPGWVGGFVDWTTSFSNTNTAVLTDPSQSQIANYVKAPQLFKCPADTYMVPGIGPRVRSVSLNGALPGSGGSGPTVQGNNPPGRKYYGQGATGTGSPVKKLSELNKPGPARTFLFLDEHPDSINDGTLMNDPGYSPGAEKWRDLPGSYHNGACSISFTDGHVEMHKWQDSRTVQPVTYGAAGTPWRTLLVVSADYEWMQDGMPYREQ